MEDRMNAGRLLPVIMADNKMKLQSPGSRGRISSAISFVALFIAITLFLPSVL